MENLSIYFATFVAFVALTLSMTEWIKTTFQTEGFGTQLASWLVGLFLAMFGWLFQLGIFETEWYFALLIGFGSSLVTNGIADTGLVQMLFQFMGILQPTKPPQPKK